MTLQEASDHVPYVSDQFHTYTDGNDLAILINKDTFEPGAAVFPITEPATSKDTRGLAALVVRGMLRQSHFAQSISTTKSPRNVMQPDPSCSHGATRR